MNQPPDESAARRRPKRQSYPALLIFLFGAWIAWWAGRRGFMPLDHSIVFDGGWRILSGQVPWRDFDAPSFITPSYIQALFFSIGGVTWKSYLAHAAAANGLFAALVFLLLVRVGLTRGFAVFYSLLSALLFYPPVGLPFTDQHAFLFSLLAVFFAVTGRLASTGRGALLAWALVPAMLCSGFFCKQLPTVLTPVAVALVLLLPSARPRREGLVGLALGAGLTLLAGVGLLVLQGVELEHVRYCLFELPLAEAEQRMGYMPSGLRLVRRFLVAGNELAGLLWAPAVALVWAAFMVARGLRVQRSASSQDPATVEQAVAEVLESDDGSITINPPPGQGPTPAEVRLELVGMAQPWAQRGVVIGLLALFFVLANQVTLVLANNQDGAAVAFFIPALGLAHASGAWILAAARLLTPPEDEDQRDASADMIGAAAASLGANAWETLVRRARSVVRHITEHWGLAWSPLVLVALLHTYGSFTKVVVPRAANDMTFDEETAVLITPERSPVLAGMLWQTPEYHRYPLEDLLAVAAELTAREGDFLLIGDSAVLYGMTARPSRLPSLWFHPGVTIAPKGTPAFRAWQQRILDDIDAGRIRRIVEERAGTWIQSWRLVSLPLLSKGIVARGGFVEQDFGAFRLLELNAPVIPEAAEPR